MAQQIINNGETGLQVRTKLNDNFTELYTGKDSVTVNTYADLPDPTTVPQQKYWVLTSTGVFLVNRRSKGAYYSDGAVWSYLGDYPTTADQLGNVPAGSIAATNVQAAINELDGDLTAHIGSGGAAHAAVTGGSNGFMVAADKTKLDAITGTNTGDQTSIVGITGTIAQFNTALSDGDFATGGGTATGTNTGDQTTITGNAGTATALQTSRNFSISGSGWLQWHRGGGSGCVS
jgi:hypothetical protein